MMSCPPYTAGDLRGLQVIDEITFGITPKTALKYAGDLQNISGGSTNMNAVKQRYGGTRTYNEMTFEAPSFGYSASFNFKNEAVAKDWATVWGIYTLGSLTQLKRDLPTFSTLIQGSANAFNLASGCMVNTLKISSAGLGTPITFDVDIMCRAIQQSTSRAFTGIQDVTLGANTPSSNAEILHMMDFPKIDNVRTPVKTWDLTINNQVFGSPDKVGTKILANGNCLASESVDITFTATRLAGNESWNTLKYDLTKNLAVSIPVGNRTVNLTDGAVMGADFPTRLQGQYDESLTVEFRGITIS